PERGTQLAEFPGHNQGGSHGSGSFQGEQEDVQAWLARDDGEPQRVALRERAQRARTGRGSAAAQRGPRAREGGDGGGGRGRDALGMNAMSSRLRWTPLVLVGLGAVLPLQATWAERPPVAPADARALTELAPPRPSPPPSTEWTPPEDG